MRRLSYLLFISFWTTTACIAKKPSVTLDSQSGSLGREVFIAACTAKGQSDDVTLAKSLMQSVETKDCEVAWQRVSNSKRLMLSGFGIRDVKLLSVFPNLEEVYLTNNKIQDLRPLASLKHLKKLDVSFNEIRDLRGVSALSELTELVVSGNSLSSLTPLAPMVRLEVLDFSENNVQDLSPLRALHALKILALHDNGVKDLAALQELRSLEQLFAERNDISSVMPIRDHAQLIPKRLHLEGNPITKDGCPTTGESAAIRSFCLAIRGIAP